jgi:large subunit ribosomal protein L37Ae
MSKRTKKVAQAGQFGPRYGVRDRVRWRDVDRRMRAPHTCPGCGQPKLSRTDTSIWACRKCGTKFAGGAYQPQTDAGLSTQKAIQGVLEKLRAESEGVSMAPEEA